MDIFDHVNNLSESVIAVHLRKAEKSGYVCPKCGSGSHEHGTGIKPREWKGKIRWKCFSCGEDYSNVDILVEEWGVKGKEIAKRLAREFNFSFPKEQVTTELLTAKIPHRDYTEFYKKAAEKFAEESGEIRALPVEFLCKVNAGIATAEMLKAEGEGVPIGGKYLILPYNANHFFMRGLNNEVKRGNTGGRGREIYNPLNAFSSSQVFVVEGQIDALSIMYATGKKAIGVGSAVNLPKLPERLQAMKVPREVKIIILADNDETGKKFAEKGVEKLRSVGYMATYFTFSEGTDKVDANGILQSDDGISKLQQKLVEIVELAEIEFARQLQEKTGVEILAGVFDELDEDSEKLRGVEIKTGYARLDRKLPLIPGVYLLGALPSMGKTTLALNIAANICEGGTPILYVSYEQSAKEVAYKDLARYWFIKNGKVDKTPTAIEIRLGKYDEEEKTEMKEVRKEVKKNRQQFYFLQGQNETAAQLIEKIEPYVSAGVKFIVIDYIQLMPSADANDTTREGIDATIRELKLYQMERNIVILFVSSFNRQNYKQYINYESFKESGGLEYTADAILGLQFRLKDEKNRSDNKQFQRMKNEQPRKMELVCVKNRNGETFELEMDYYARHDYYEECEEEEGLRW